MSTHIKARTPLTRGYACPRWDSNRVPALVNTGKSRKHRQSDPIRPQYAPVRSPKCAHCAHPLFVYFGAQKTGFC
jgi:beta-galactosidase GanA